MTCWKGLWAGALLVGCGAEVAVSLPVGGGAGGGGDGAGDGAGGAGGGCVEGPGAWRQELVMEGGHTITDAVTDSRGAMHVIVDNGELVHVHGVEGDWAITPLGPTPLWTTTLALGPDDSLHLGLGAYHWMYQTAYWTNRSGAWETFDVSSQGGPAGVAVHPDGTPHLIYLDWPGGRFLHVIDPAQEDAPRRELVAPGYEGSPAMAFDGEGRLWLAYIGVGPALEVGTLAPGQPFEVRVSEPQEHLAHVSDLEIDAGGAVHVAYVGEYENAYHGRLDAGGWSSELLDGAVMFPGSDYPPRIAIAPDGHPSVAITREGDHPPLYLRHDGSTWHGEEVLEPAHRITSMRIDEVGAAHLMALELGQDTKRRVWYLTNRSRCAMD